MENYQSDEETLDFDQDAITRDIYDDLEAEPEDDPMDEDDEDDDEEEESVDPAEFEADPEEDDAEDAATAAFEARQRDNVPNPVLPPFGAPQISKPRAFNVFDPNALQLARSDALSALSDDDETVDPEHDPKHLAIVNPKLRTRKNAQLSIGLARKHLADQDMVIANLLLQIDDARYKRTSLQSKLNYAKKHHKSTTSKLRAQQFKSLKTTEIKLRNRDQKIKYAHIDGVCDGVKYNYQKCLKLSRGYIMRDGKRCDFCTEHETKIKFPNAI